MATFSDSVGPAMGIVTTRVAPAATAAGSPWASLPSTRATGSASRTGRRRRRPGAHRGRRWRRRPPPPGWRRARRPSPARRPGGTAPRRRPHAWAGTVDRPSQNAAAPPRRPRPNAAGCRRCRGRPAHGQHQGAARRRRRRRPATGEAGDGRDRLGVTVSVAPARVPAAARCTAAPAPPPGQQGLGGAGLGDDLDQGHARVEGLGHEDRPVDDEEPPSAGRAAAPGEAPRRLDLGWGGRRSPRGRGRLRGDDGTQAEALASSSSAGLGRRGHERREGDLVGARRGPPGPCGRPRRRRGGGRHEPAVGDAVEAAGRR